MRKLKQQNGITLVALVITIIILLILAGIVISTLSNNGLFKQTSNARKQQQKQARFEDVQLSINEATIEMYYNVSSNQIISSRNLNSKSEQRQTFIQCINKNVLEKSWVSETLKCDIEGKVQELDENNTVLLIDTIDGFEIKVEVDNENIVASVDTTYYEDLSKITYYKISYNGNDSTTGSMDVQNVRTGWKAVLKENPYTKEGYEFVGWTMAEDGTGEVYLEGASIKLTGDITLYAKWTKDAKTVTFDANGGTGIMETKEVAKNIETELPDESKVSFEREGYYFIGWSKEEGENKTVITTITTDKDIILYAQWKEYLKISFNANGGEGTTIETIKAKEGDKVTLTENTYTRIGYNFAGWSVTPNGDIVYNDNEKNVTVNESIILYAIWNDATEPSVSLTGTLGSITFSAIDDESGIVGYAISQDDSVPSEYVEWDGEETNYNITNDTCYYLWIKNGSNLYAKKKFKIHKHSGNTSSQGRLLFNTCKT